MDAGEGSDGGGSKRERVWCSCTEIMYLSHVCAAGVSSHTCSDYVMKRCTECKAMCSVCGSINGAFQTPTSRCAARLPRLPTRDNPGSSGSGMSTDVSGSQAAVEATRCGACGRCGAVTTRQHRAASVMTSRTAMLRTSGAARIRHSSKLTVKIH